MSLALDPQEKHKWTIEALDLSSDLDDMVPGELEGPGTVEGLNLAPGRGGVPPQGIALQALSALRKQANAILAGLPALADPDPEAEGEEWKDVTSLRNRIAARLGKTELRDNDIATAQAEIVELGKAKATALSAIQVRLGGEAKKIRDQAALDGKPDPDAKDDEWASVKAACDAVENALPDSGLKKADILAARAEADKIAGLAEDARKAIAARIKAEAQDIRDKIAPLAERDPEAQGDEWDGVTSAAEAVSEALSLDPLHNADITSANDRLLLLQTAGNDARAQIQLRLQAAVQVIRDKITPHRTPNSEAIGTEWDRVTAACDAAEGKLPTGILTAKLLEPAEQLQKRIPVIAKAVTAAIEARLRKSLAEVDARLKSYEKPDSGDETLWKPVTDACAAVRLGWPKGAHTRVAIDELNRQVDETVESKTEKAYEELWTRDKTAAIERANATLGTGKSSNKAFMGLLDALKESPVFKAHQAKTKQALVPADAATYRSQRDELKRLSDAACTLVAKLKATLTEQGLTANSEPDAVKAALDAVVYRQQAKHALDKLKERAAAEAAASDKAKEKAEEKYVFRDSVAEADKALTDAAKALTKLRKDIDDEVKEWGKSRSFAYKLTQEEFGAEELESVLSGVKGRDVWLAGKISERLAQEKIIAGVLATYADKTPVQQIDKLEALRDAVRKKLDSGTATRIRNRLESKKGIPLAVWTKALSEGLQAQIAKLVPGTTWAARFNMGHDTGESWGIDNTGNVQGVRTHITLYPAKVSASHTGTAAEIVDAIMGSDVNGVHVTKEQYGADSANNPRVYRGGEFRNLPRNMAANQEPLRGMTTILNNYLATLPAIAQQWKDRAGLTPEQISNNEAYVAEIEAEISKLT